MIFTRKQKKVWITIAIFLSLGGATYGNPLKPRILSGFPNNVLIVEHRYLEKDPWLEIEAVIPQIIGATDFKWQENFNEGLRQDIREFIDKIRKSAWKTKETDPYTASFPFVGMVDYEIKLNRGGLLSLTLTFYQYSGGAHGMTYLESVNLDLTTGQVLTFEDVFQDPADRDHLAEIINEEIKKEPAWYFIEEFRADMFGDPQQFYMQENGIVAYFGLYEIAPYVSGIRKFLLPLE